MKKIFSFLDEWGFEASMGFIIYMLFLGIIGTMSENVAKYIWN